MNRSLVTRLTVGAAALTLAGCESFPRMDVHQQPLPRHPPDHRSQFQDISDDVSRTPSEKAGKPTVFTEKDVSEAVPMAALEAYSLLPFARYVYGEPNDVRISVDTAKNTLILTGEERQVAIVSDRLHAIDNPTFQGMHAAIVEPEFLSVDTFAKKLTEGLGAAGIAVSPDLKGGHVVTLVPHGKTDEVFILVGSEELARLKALTEEIDAYKGDPDAPSVFVYRVRNTDASNLAASLPGGAPLGMPNPALNGSLMVDTIGNKILFAGTYRKYQEVHELLNKLDVRPKQVLIQAEVAEVSLNDETHYGLEFYFEQHTHETTAVGGTKGGLGLAKTGFSYIFSGKDIGATFQAYASNNKVNLLSRPRVFVRSGSEASVQVGSDVPIITQVASTNIQNNGQSAILEQITYRQTGTILRIKPVVYGDRVDLQVNQEISAQQPDAVAAINSPVILKRSLQTTLSLQEGDTALLGGLIEDQYTKGNGGVPLMKDIPLLGQAFRADTVTGGKVDLVLLLTPYIVDDSNDMTDITNAFDADMNRAFLIGRSYSYTLLPWSVGRNIGGSVPAVHPADRGEVVEGKPTIGK